MGTTNSKVEDITKDSKTINASSNSKKAAIENESESATGAKKVVREETTNAEELALEDDTEKLVPMSTKYRKYPASLDILPFARWTVPRSELASDHIDREGMLQVNNWAINVAGLTPVMIGLEASYTTLIGRDHMKNWMKLGSLNAIFKQNFLAACFVSGCLACFQSLGMASPTTLQIQEEHAILKEKEKLGDMKDIRISFGQEAYESFIGRPSTDMIVPATLKYGASAGFFWSWYWQSRILKLKREEFQLLPSMRKGTLGMLGSVLLGAVLNVMSGNWSVLPTTGGFAARKRLQEYRMEARNARLEDKGRLEIVRAAKAARALRLDELRRMTRAERDKLSKRLSDATTDPKTFARMYGRLRPRSQKTLYC